MCLLSGDSVYGHDPSAEHSLDAVTGRNAVEKSRDEKRLQRLIAAWLQASQEERARFLARFQLLRARLRHDAAPRTGARPYHRHVP